MPDCCGWDKSRRCDQSTSSVLSRKGSKSASVARARFEYCANSSWAFNRFTNVLRVDNNAAGWQTIDNNVAGNAMALIQRRVEAAREGALTLNGEDDQDLFEKQTGLKPYALQNSPLITLFTLPGSSVDTL